MSRFKPLWALYLVLLVTGCAKSNEEEERAGSMGGSNTCNTTNMSYTMDIVPIIQANCYACHSTANQSISGINLEGYSNLKIMADDGRLVGVITHANGYPPMPQTGAKLADCTINKIKSWVASGSPNN